jgi:enoyl-CoA hydratase
MSEILNITSQLSSGIFYLTINRPDKLNALNKQTLSELAVLLNQASDDDDVKGIIITGAGEKAFVAGADIREIAELNELNSRKFAEQGQEVFFMIENSSKPVIAAINGFALGGGCELAMACHLRLAASNAKFGLPEVTLGIIPGFGGTQRLTQLIGKGRATEMIMTGEMIDAQTALSFGLINHITENDNLLEEATQLMRKILGKAPIAIAQVIECINAAYSAEEDGFQAEAKSFGILCKSKDFIEGTTAFLEKRAPEFSGK